MSPEYLSPGVYVEELKTGLHPIPGVPTSTAAFVGASAQGPLHVPTPVSSFADFERVFGRSPGNPDLGHAVRQFFANGGRAAVVVRADGPTAEAALAGLDASAFNLLCLPPLLPGVDLPVATRVAAAALCRRRRALFIVDPAVAWASARDAEAGLESYMPQRGAESALYFPFVRGPDPLANGQVRTFAPCGAIAGVMARTDVQRGVWKAPAGTDVALKGGLSPAIALANRDSEILNPLGINALRSFSPVGTVPWGARTLARPGSADAEYKYVPVRRFAMFLEESLSQGLQGLVFEPNTAATWARVRTAVADFLYDLFRQGAMAANTTQDAFFVKCDATTTTEADIAAGRANLLIGFAPLKPAEFVILRLELRLAGGDA
ncbi:MAG: phage tail sheath subtilisin-like domain-containing protein [Proteobacteria bacterium]|nr:phage tail sheath subtilisin-like domain-containing protein [Pseudomonadota bacterium]